MEACWKKYAELGLSGYSLTTFKFNFLFYLVSVDMCSLSFLLVNLQLSFHTWLTLVNDIGNGILAQHYHYQQQQNQMQNY